MRWVVPLFVGIRWVGIPGPDSSKRRRSPLSKMAPRPITFDGGNFGSVARAHYGRGVGKPPRVRGLPYNLSQPGQSHMTSRKLWNGVRARRLFVRPTATSTDDIPIVTTLTTTVEKKNPDVRISTDRRVVADVRRVNLGFQPPPPVLPCAGTLVGSLSAVIGVHNCVISGDPSWEGKTRHFAGLSVSQSPSCVIIDDAHRTTGQPHRLRNRFSILLPGYSVRVEWCPANFAIFGDAVSAIQSQCGAPSTDWYRPFPFLSRLNVEGGLFLDRKIRPRQEINTSTCE